MLIDEGLELLDTDQCEALLGTTAVGRVGITMAGLPVILPVNYTYVDNSIVFRTSEGTKLHAASNGAVIAFEIDDYNQSTHRGWSVLVVGRAEHVTEPLELAALDKHQLAPWADGERREYVRVTPELLSGRRIVP